MYFIIYLLFNLVSLHASMNNNEAVHSGSPEKAQEVPAKRTWTCSMHPQIKMEEPGKCPICFMDLIPLASSQSLAKDVIELSPSEQKSAGIQTYPLKHKHDQINLLLYGRVNLVPALKHHITAWVSGRVDRLYVSSIGEKVKIGDPLYEIYSPALVASQQELIQANKFLKESKKDGTRFQFQQGNLAAIRQKLLYLGLTLEDLQKIGQQKEPNSHIVIRSKRKGVIRHVAISEGEYVKEGSPILLLADMSKLWVEASVYEDDLRTVRGPMRARILLDSHPQEEIIAKLVRIDPFVDPKTRSSRAIFSISNPRGEFHEDGFARVQIETRSKPGLLIPHSAALFTGQKAAIFIKVENRFQAKLVRILEKTESYYRVMGDLKPGDEVVVEGTFKLDSEFQIQARESMMSSKELMSPYGARLDFRAPLEKALDWMAQSKPSAVFRAKLDPLRTAYLELHLALAEDSFDESKEIIQELGSGLRNSLSLENSMHESRVLKLLLEELETSLQKVSSTKVFKDLRQTFALLGKWFIAMTEEGWMSADSDLKKLYCPMAFDKKGAFWIQEDEDVMNPFFGSEMLGCGEIQQWGE
ncbi:efflux RND transporter periplasmic adaptor subunit [bacterium]|jgi:membrane fusion protein, copper/silver efflux system|nr:efflux RND transporter periplasmic adaptor subunit [bacterium]